MHHALERRMYRVWFANQVLEVSWGRSPVGIGILNHSNDGDSHDRFFWVALGFIQFFIPIGVYGGDERFGDEPAYSIRASVEDGVSLHWGTRYWIWWWAFRTKLLEWDYETKDRTWVSILHKPKGLDSFTEYLRRREKIAKTETHPYSYRLRSGEVQNVNATITRERRVLGRCYLHRLGWPKRYETSIDIAFDNEVGERAGDWKGGCVG